MCDEMTLNFNLHKHISIVTLEARETMWCPIHEGVYIHMGGFSFGAGQMGCLASAGHLSGFAL